MGMQVKIATTIALFIFMFVTAASCGPKVNRAVLSQFDVIWPGTVHSDQFYGLVSGVCEMYYATSYGGYWCHGDMENYRVVVSFTYERPNVINGLTLSPLNNYVSLGDLIEQFGRYDRAGHSTGKCRQWCAHFVVWDLEDGVRLTAFVKTPTDLLSLFAPVQTISVVQSNTVSGPR